MPRIFSIQKAPSEPIFIFFIILVVSYGLYFHLGSSRYLTHYYSPSEQLARLKAVESRRLFAEFKKEEFRLKLKLEENPKDQEAEWRLLDILGIKALQNGNKKEALLYWEKALQKMPPEFKPQFKERISKFLPHS